MRKKTKLVHHRSFRTEKIYDGSIRNPREGIHDNKSVGLKVEPKQAVSLFLGVAQYLTWTGLKLLAGKKPTSLLLTSYKYNKGPAGHVTTMTSTVKGNH